MGMTAREPGEERSGAVRAREIEREEAARRGSGRSGPIGGRDDGLRREPREIVRGTAAR